jgi:hypothetical protein
MRFVQILGAPAASRLADVFPRLLAVLPLKKDHAEDKPVYDCLMRLLAARVPEAMAHLPQLFSVLAQVIPPESGVAEPIRAAVVSGVGRLGLVSIRCNRCRFAVLFVCRPLQLQDF